jgi:glycosyltransferase involved in cell wall biosynthesis
MFFTGPGAFANRLARRLFESGHEVVFNNEGADISLVFIERSGAPLAKRVVQRLDGIWFKPTEYHTKNVGIKSLYESADAVVWQSEFDRNMTTKWWGSPKLGRVINNGIELNPVKELTIPTLIDLRRQYDRIYVCSSNWHPQKRLAANVQLFERIHAKYPSSCLFILGNNPDYRATGPHIFYTGSVKPDVYNQIYSAANWMLHLAWADHCPNVVIEALAQGTPVVCSEVGGTKELVGNYGMVLKEQPYDYELVDYDNPPSIDLSQVDDLPDRLTLDYKSIADIDIRHVADKYVQLFETVLKQ